MPKSYNTVTRPFVHYHGGKWTIAPWIISTMPPHRIYVELFGGGGSILLRKSRSWSEIYNDLDSDIVNLFRMARDRGGELLEKIRLTPYAREEYELSFQKTDDPLERARRTIVRSYFGFGSTAILYGDGKSHPGFRANLKMAGSSSGHQWRTYLNTLSGIIERLQGVVIENKNAFDLIDPHDSPNTLFYADPPYLPSVRDTGTDYRFEMTEEDHINLARKLNEVKGGVIVSGYSSELYDDLYKKWDKREKSTHADGNGARIEVLWIKNIATGLFD